MVMKAKFLTVREKISKRERIKRTLYCWIGIRGISIRHLICLNIHGNRYRCTCVYGSECIRIFWPWH